MSFRDVPLAPALDAILDGPSAPWDCSRCQGHSAPATTGLTLSPEVAGAKAKRGEWVTQEREDYLRRAWPGDVPLTEIKVALSAMPGPPIPNGGSVGNFCTKTLQVKRTVAHETWATAERKAYLQQAWPADVPMAEIVVALAAMGGRQIPANSDRIQAYASKALGLHRSDRQTMAIKAVAAAYAKRRAAGLLERRQRPPPPPPPRPVEVRGTPGIAMPPQAREWHEIVAFGLRIGKLVANRHDLPGLNRWRVANGYAPLAVKAAGTWRPPSYKPWE